MKTPRAARRKNIYSDMPNLGFSLYDVYYLRHA